MGLVVSGGGSIIHFTGLSRHEVLQETLRFMARFLQPTVAKLDPHLLHRAWQQLQVAERYALTMLQKRNLPAERHLRVDEAHSLIRQLVYAYPAHGYVICREEARKLGLPIENAEEHPRWAEIRSAYRKFEEDETSVVSVLLDSELDASVSLAFQEQESDKGSEDEEL